MQMVCDQLEVEKREILRLRHLGLGDGRPTFLESIAHAGASGAARSIRCLAVTGLVREAATLAPLTLSYRCHV